MPQLKRIKQFLATSGSILPVTLIVLLTALGLILTEFNIAPAFEAEARLPQADLVCHRLFLFTKFNAGEKIDSEKVAKNSRPWLQKLARLGVTNEHRLVVNGAALAAPRHQLVNIPKGFNDQNDGTTAELTVAQDLDADSANGPQSYLLVTPRVVSQKPIIDLVIGADESMFDQLTSENILDWHMIRRQLRLRAGDLTDFMNETEISMRMFFDVKKSDEVLNKLNAGENFASDQELSPESQAQIFEQSGLNAALDNVRGAFANQKINLDSVYSGIHMSEQNLVLALILKAQNIPEGLHPADVHVTLYRLVYEHMKKSSDTKAISISTSLGPVSVVMNPNDSI